MHHEKAYEWLRRRPMNGSESLCSCKKAHDGPDWDYYSNKSMWFWCKRSASRSPKQLQLLSDARDILEDMLSCASVPQVQPVEMLAVEVLLINRDTARQSRQPMLFLFERGLKNTFEETDLGKFEILYFDLQKIVSSPLTNGICKTKVFSRREL